MRNHEGQARAINSEEFQRVIDTTLETSDFSLRDCAILAVSFYAGLRAMEIAALNIEDIVSQDGEIKNTITLRKAGTKGGMGGVAYLSNPNLREHLSRYIVEKRCYSATVLKRSSKTTGSGWAGGLEGAVFISRVGKRFSPSSMSRLFTRLYTTAGLEGCSSHTGRRSLCKNLNGNGVSIYNIQKIMRHADISQTVRYIDVDEDLLANICSTV